MNQSGGDTLEDPAPGAIAEEQPCAPQLFVVLECDRPGSGGARYSLSNIDEVIVGRGQSRSCTRSDRLGVRSLRLDLPGRFVSAIHARICRMNREFVIEDVASTNGTFVNGTRVHQARLSDADVVEIGHTILLVRSGVPTPVGTPDDDDWALRQTGDPELCTLLPALAASFATMARVARSSVPMILSGETGTGKERLARAVHRISGRPGPMVAVNCGAISPHLVESQLFGHTKGAFSGAIRDEPGFLRTASTGTLLLDEVDELLPGAQVALLRALQEQEVVPVGASRAVSVDLRVVAASHRPLNELAEQGRFRRDLYARLAGFTQALRPLRARVEDLGVIVAGVLPEGDADLRFKPSLGVTLASYPWPYNVRELVQRFKRALALRNNEPLTEADWGLEPIGDYASRLGAESQGLDATEVEVRDALVRALEESRGNVSQAARTMGKARMQIQRWIKRFDVDPARFRPLR